MMFMRRDFAVEVVGSYDAPSVLDVGCGSGRVAENLIDAGAGQYTGVDFSEPMLELASERLRRFGDRVRLETGDFLEADLGGPYDVVVALGFFDYIENPVPFVTRMRELCKGSVVASFPEWTWVKGPLRKIRYEVLADCPIFNYTSRELELMFQAAGFKQVSCTERNGGILLRADV